MTSPHPEPVNRMGLPLSNGKLAMWLFLATEVMFFTALIGTYLLLRNGPPGRSSHGWPTAEQVHVNVWVGAGNTLLLVASSLTALMAHLALRHGRAAAATGYVALTLLLGGGFLLVKGYEYREKIAHDLLPDRIGEALPGMSVEREKLLQPTGQQYVSRVRAQLDEVIRGVTPDNLGEQSEKVLACYRLRREMEESKEAGGDYIRPLTPAQLGARVNTLLKEHDNLHLTPAIPFGNLWASCYFALTGAHALHVLGGLLAFGAILVVGLAGGLHAAREGLLANTCLYWHFVDLVWLVLFPLVYLI